MKQIVEIVTSKKYHTSMYLSREKGGMKDLVVVKLTHNPKSGIIDIQYTNTNILICYEYTESHDFVVDIYSYPSQRMNGWMTPVGTLYDEWNSPDIDTFVENILQKVEA